MKKIILVLVVFACSYTQGMKAQGPAKNPSPPESAFQWNRVFWGGNLGAQFGSVTALNISPLIGYKITERVQVGVGATYLYFNYQMYNFSSTMYGGSVFGRIFVLENVFLHAEYEVLNIDSYDFPGMRTNIENEYIGVGFRQPFGERSSYTIMVLWNANETKYSPYSNPVIRLGFNFGL